ncbi:MAG: hypothetical protein H0X03_09750 [Nitrosopumilus sp.]|nr:hypothetical protein [Nitrosopumilus sp.]
MKLKFIQISENPLEGVFTKSLSENSKIHGLRSDQQGAFLICSSDETSSNQKNRILYG